MRKLRDPVTVLLMVAKDQVDAGYALDQEPRAQPSIADRYGMVMWDEIPVDGMTVRMVKRPKSLGTTMALALQSN